MFSQINSVFLLIGLRVVMSSVPTRDASFFSRVRTWLKSSAVLVCLLGVTWVFGLLFLKDSRTTVFAYIFTIMNSLQVERSFCRSRPTGNFKVKPFCFPAVSVKPKPKK